MANVFTGNIDGKWVAVLVTDLNEFIHAGPESEIFCEDKDGNQFRCMKSDIDFDNVNS